MTDPTQPITRDDIEQGFRDIQGEITGELDAAKPKLISVGVGVGVLVIVIAYLLGRRVGKTKSTVVEIRRI